ncbi:hypothetical protein [Bradyrhizobium sp. AZCC 2289]|uniref:hypothetical protein n=1 Tax=Bradyrhizobium sp. AZCC 2289 TaxID=3117026 RepID=UPI002FF1C4A7
MNDISECREMELRCLQRARAEPENSWKWLGQAERWRELAHSRVAVKFQKPVAQQQMTAGPMQMGPDPITGRQLQQ